MTAFGRARLKKPQGYFVAEIQSLNRKHLEITTSLPKEAYGLEIEVRRLVAEMLARGKIQIKISLEAEAETSLRIRPNLALAREIKSAWLQIAKELNIPFEDARLCELLIRESADLLGREEGDCGEELKEGVLESLLLALKDLEVMRQIEGEFLKKDFSMRIGLLRELFGKIEQAAGKTKAVYEERLRERLQAFDLEDNEDKILREVALLAEKLDISEEITRFRSHLDQFTEIMNAKEGGVGKTLDFLLQELFREVNTVGSKAQDIEITRWVIQAKGELESLREQVQNVE